MKLNIQIEGATVEQFRAIALAMGGGVTESTPPLSGSEAQHAIADEITTGDKAEASTATTEEPPTNPAGVELDATGVPWDERIHSSNKQKTAKGHWNKRRNVDPAKFNEIHAQLLANQSAPAAPAQAPVTPDSIVAAVSDTPPPASPEATTPPPPPAAAEQLEDDAPKTFGELIAAITERDIDRAKVNGAAEELGLTGIEGLATRADLIPAFWNKIK